jgi:glycosyltransferase involved in cell wall biosynthesis
MPVRRFAFVAPNYHPRTCGVADHTMRLVQELQRRGFECAIFTRTPAQTNPVATDVTVTGFAGATPLVIAERIRRSVEAFAPTDVVLQYTPQMFGASRFGSPAAIWLAGAARRMGCRVVVLAHELFLPWSTRPDVTLGAALMHLQLAGVLRTAHRLLVTVDRRAQQISKLARAVGHRAPIGVVRVGPGALPVKRTARRGPFRIGTFSTLGRDKRFDTLLDGFRIVHARRPDAELVILGDLGDDRDPRIRAFHEAVRQHPGAARIRTPGKQDLATIARELADVDVYLHMMQTGANTRSSTLPVALGTGLPVVAFRGVETDDLFVDGDNLLFADRLSGDGFAAAVLRIAEDDELAARLSRGATALYESHLRWDKIADRLLAEIDAAGSGPPASG